jgi:hypothetical protein
MKTVPHLDTIPAVNLDLSLVIFPENTELDDSFGDLGDRERALVFGMPLEERPERGGDFSDGPKDTGGIS